MLTTIAKHSNNNSFLLVIILLLFNTKIPSTYFPWNIREILEVSLVIIQLFIVWTSSLLYPL